MLNFNLYKKLGSCCLITFLAITSIVHTHEMKFRKTWWNSLISDWNIAPLLINSIMSPCLNENWAMHIGMITVYILCIRYKTILKCNKTPKIRINLTVNVFNRVAVAVEFTLLCVDFIIVSYCPFFDWVICSISTSCGELPIRIFSKSFYYDLVW